MKKNNFVVALVAGVIFGIGLGISGMTRPEKVTGFLDVAGHWDPSLAFVMMGAIAVHFVANRIARARTRPLGSDRFHFPEATGIDKKLVVGALVFGVGWGLAGICPGPAVVVAASGNILGIVFVVSMLTGMFFRRSSAKG